ncbi:MAG: hypothetical protein ABW076_16585 [Candidatus Thiodiazotropha sp.]
MLGCVAANATSPSEIMSRAMLSMMDAMGNLAFQFKKDDGWDFSRGTQPFNSGISPFMYQPWNMPGTSSYMPGGLSGYPGGFMPGTVPGMTPGLSPGTMSGLPGSYLPGQSMLPSSPASQYRYETASELDGIWVGRSGEIVLVMYGYFRIYASAETYRDGRYRIEEDRILMHDPESGVTQTYQFRLDEGRMIMRGESGNILLFKKLPIPIPAYMLLPESG